MTSASNTTPCEFLLSLEDLLDIVSTLKIGPVRDPDSQCGSTAPPNDTSGWARMLPVHRRQGRALSSCRSRKTAR